MDRRVNIRTLLQLLASVYLIAFVSLGVQAQGLIGSHGILPVGDFLASVHRQLGSAAYWNCPTAFWLNSSDGALRAGWILGALCALAAILAPIFPRWPPALRKAVTRAAFAGCLILWLSLCVVGQDFLSFQWDVLLLEAGFLAIFADDSTVRIWLFRWLIFRLMFYSGAVKLLSHDPSWRNLTALHYHYETQPLPTPLAWYMEQLPMWFQELSTAFTFFAELIVPFLFFAPKPIRRVAAWIVIALQTLILLTGNYTFFNLLAIILTLFLFVDPKPAPMPGVRGRVHRAASIALVAFIGVVSGCVTLQMFSVDLPGESAVLRLAEPLRIVNSYGLFAVMTTERLEIVVEGSNDGSTWLAYEFPYKPGDLRRAPPIVAPHQPRLDWQMWFAALGNYQSNRWFVGFMLRLLQGEPSVVRLLRYNPFPNAPPKYIRARAYQYHFTKFGEPGWWKREEHGLYFPVVSLK
jgi:hypothetical protein